MRFLGPAAEGAGRSGAGCRVRHGGNARAAGRPRNRSTWGRTARGRTAGVHPVLGDEVEPARLEPPRVAGPGLGAEGEEPTPVDADAPSVPLEALDAHDVGADLHL